MIKPGQLRRWRDNDLWFPSLAGKNLVIIEVFTHTNHFGDDSPAARFLVDGRIEWRHEEDVMECSRVIDEAG
jgi:hypothetical protein